VDLSPFPYQGPLEPDQVRGRDDLVAELTERVTEHRVTALLGPRRYGKTSVLRRVAADVIGGGAAVVWVDLYEVASMADLAARLDDALARIAGRFGEALAKVAASVQVNLGLVRVELRAPSRDRPDPVLTVHALLDVLTRFAATHPTMVFVDEFSGIARVDGAAGLLRTGLQHHFQDLGLVFAGSEPSMMRTLFTEQAQPFYAQADLVEIDPLPVEALIEQIGDGFASTGRVAGVVARHVAAFSDGHPQRAMQLADAAWRLVPPGDEGTDATWAEALDRVRSATADGNERLYSALQEKERSVLRVLASGGAVFGAQAELLDLGGGAAQHARQRLVELGHVVVRGSRHEVVDPVFADWIRNRFPI
jgi:hypothetical protein